MRVLITGAATGFGRGAALELAQRGHDVLAAVQIAPQATELLAAAAGRGVHLQVLVLDVTDATDVAVVAREDLDVLVNNAGVMETGPVAEIPLARVRRNFEVNVFGTLAMCQAVVPRMVARGSGRIVNVSSMGGLVTVPLAAAYTATKHALESLSEGLKAELTGTGVQVCTLNPGLFGTGFNDRGAETMLRWFDPAASFSPPQLLAGLSEGLREQLDPAVAVEALVNVVEAESPMFRTVVPEGIVPWIQAVQQRAWRARTDEDLFADPAASADQPAVL
ncbi:SDR family oxidoreductase [Kineococcus gypseus]|uniref:SDR family oxidoreductase n=1 Tax=Kineococcus gypseus TaxID=1637102 RepID=UPI003D7E6539